MMKKHWNRKGFSLAEVLIVVAIIVILAGVGFVGLLSHMRSMEQLELDGHAKELFVAAQNHLAMADSQGFLGKVEFDKTSEAPTGVFGATSTYGDDANKGIYYYVVNASVFDTAASGYDTIKYNNPNNKDSVLNQILPMSSADESARTGGSYIIRYQKYPAKILDVFYVSTSGRYSLEGGLTSDDYSTVMALRDDAAARRNNFKSGKSILGYYGGEAAANLVIGDKLNAPTVEIINAEKLQIKVIFNNSAGVTDPNKKDRNSLTLMITGEQSHQSIPYELVVNGSDNSSTYSNAEPSDSANPTKEYIITLDDITTANAHFANTLTSFYPGENLLVTAEAFNNNVSTNIADSGVHTTNSIFDSYDKDNQTVFISNIRHLQNLETTVSYVNGDSSKIVTISNIVQKSDLDWNDFRENINKVYLKKTADHYEDPIQIYYMNSSTPLGADLFYPIVLSGKTYNDPAQDANNTQLHRIYNIKVSTAGPAGLFSTVSGSSIYNLELVDFDITSTGKSGEDPDSMAGALAGSVTNSIVKGVLVRNSKVDGGDISLAIRANNGGIAGGLAGNLSGSTVETSAAAVYVSAAGDAGGLIGLASGSVTVDSCYSGGHTEIARYVTLGKGTKTNVNVISTGGNAGGLIGNAAGTNADSKVTVKASYSTCSVVSSASTESYGAGGFIGNANYVNAEHCYSVGLVGGKKEHAFIAKFSNTTVSADCNFLTGVSSSDAEVKLTSLSNISGASVGQESTIFDMTSVTQGNAVVYDPTLVIAGEGKYPFPTVELLTGGKVKVGITDRHIGDWQLPNLSPLNYMLINGDTLDLKIELKGGSNRTKLITLAVTGNQSTYTVGSGDDTKTYPITRVLLLEVQWTGEDATLEPSGLVLKKIFEVNEDSAFDMSNATPSSDLVNIVARRFEYIGSRTLDAQDGGEKVYDIYFHLDDITTQVGTDGSEHGYGQFGKIFTDGTALRQLLPGDNITVRVAAGDGTWAEMKNICKLESELESEEVTELTNYADRNKIDGKAVFAYNYCAATDNSLFGTDTELLTDEDGSKYYKAAILNIRHLQNLDSSTSYVNILSGTKVSKAVLMKDLDWDVDAADYEKIWSYQGNYGITHANGFIGIYNPSLTELNGYYDDEKADTLNSHTLSNFVIKNTSTNYCGIVTPDPTAENPANTTIKYHGTDNAGLFRYVKSGSNLLVSELRLLNFQVTADQYAGAVVAGNAGTVTLYTVLVEGETTNDEVKVDPGAKDIACAAGGLVGHSSGTLTIHNSAASVYVWAEKGAAGGLVGRLEAGGNLTIYKSYVGGRTGYTYVNSDTDKGEKKGVYYKGSDPVNTAAFNGKTLGRWNIVAKAGAAGGLVGETLINSEVDPVVKSTVRMEKSFNTASVYSGVATPMGGGLVGNAQGDFASVQNDTSAKTDAWRIKDAEGGVLKLVYTVAPVYKVATYATSNGVIGTTYVSGSSANAGAAVGSLSSSLNAVSAFCLADVYPDVVYSNDLTQSNIAYIGTGSATNIKLASYYAKQGTDAAAIIGILSTGSQTLEVETTTFDEGLTEEGKEFPFAIWTKFRFDINRKPSSDRETPLTHFYGDWEPAQRKGSQQFNFYFLKAMPDASGTTATITDLYTADSQAWQNERWMAIQLIPYEETTLAIPTLPYFNGYNYGARKPAKVDGAETEHYNYDTAEPYTDSAGLYVWELYIGDQRVPLKAGTATAPVVRKYTAYGGTIKLQEEDLVKASEAAALLSTETNKVNPTITMVARYYKMDDLYTLAFYDYDPKDTTFAYDTDNPYGGIRVVTKPAEGTLTFADATNIQSAPRRNRSGYHFLGWYTEKDAAGSDPGVKVYQYENGTVSLTEAGKAMTISSDVKLYAHYRKVEYVDVAVDILYVADNKTMTAPMTLQFEKGTTLSLDIPMPTSNLKGVSIKDSLAADAEDVDEDEAYFIKRSGTDFAESVHIEYSGTENKHYYVYVNYAADQVGFVVRYKMMNTDSVTAGSDGISVLNGNTYNFAATTTDMTTGEEIVPSKVFNPYNGVESGMNLKTPEDTRPTGTDYAQLITGFHRSEVEILGYNKATDSGLKTEYSLPADDKINGLEIKFIVVVTYERDEHYLFFDNTGEDYYPDVPVLYGDGIQQYINGKVPNFEGFTFSKWVYTNGATERDVDGNTRMPNEDFTVRAVYNEKPVAYTIAYWYENANDTNYTYMGMRLISADDSNKKPGDTVEAVSYSVPNYDGYDATYGQYFYFDGNSGSPYPASVTVKADGSTVLNVCLKRRMFTITFKNTGSGKYYPDDEGEYYRQDNGYYARLNKTTQWFYGTDRYTDTRYVIAGNNSGTQYGVIDGVVRQITYTDVYKYTYSIYVETTDTSSGTIYGYIPVLEDYYELRWFQNENDWGFRYYGDWYSYSVNGNGKFYKQETYTYDGPVSYSGGMNGYYYATINGETVRLTRVWDKKAWVYNGQEYTGTRYKTESGNDGIQYGFVSGQMVQLTSKVVYTKPGESTEYTGTRYSPNVIYKIKAKYEAKLNTLWSFTGADGVQYNKSDDVTTWDPSGSSLFSERMLYQDIMPGESFTLTIHSKGSKRETLNYYVEAKTDTNTFTYNNVKYEKTPYHIAIADYNFITFAEDFVLIEGYDRHAVTAGENNQTSVNWSGTRYPSSSNFSGGEVINFYYTRKHYTLTLMNGTVSQNGGNSPAITKSVKYGDSLNKQEYYGTPTIPSALASQASDYYFEGWYSDETYTTPFVFTNQTMPIGGLKIYGKWTHKACKVTFEAGTGATLSGAGVTNNQKVIPNVAYESILSDLDDDGTPTGCTVARDGYRFLYWEDQYGVRFTKTRKIVGDLTLKPVWRENTETPKANVTIKYLVADADNKPTTTEVADSVTIENQIVGEVFHVPAANRLEINDYYLVTPDPTCLVNKNSSKNEVVFLYRPKLEWKYKVEYYILYKNADLDWPLPTGTTNDIMTDSDAVLVYTEYTDRLEVTNEADGTTSELFYIPCTDRFKFISYTAPSGQDWTEQYEFDHYDYWYYDNSGTETHTGAKATPFIMIEPSKDLTKINTLKIYLVPNPEAIVIPDRNEYYNGNTHLTPSESYSSTLENMSDSPLWCKGGDTVTVHYFYYERTDLENALSADDPDDRNKVVDADTYGVSAYITVTHGSKTAVVWQSRYEEDGKPPLHLYVNRRIVFLHSAFAEVSGGAVSAPGTYENGVLRAEKVYMSANDTTPNDALTVIRNMYVILKLSDDTNAGFAPDESVEIIWSANAFRRMEGTSPNIFTYKKTGDLKESNYNFFMLYGDLTVP